MSQSRPRVFLASPIYSPFSGLAGVEKKRWKKVDSRFLWDGKSARTRVAHAVTVVKWEKSEKVTFKLFLRPSNGFLSVKEKRGKKELRQKLQ